VEEQEEHLQLQHHKIIQVVMVQILFSQQLLPQVVEEVEEETKLVELEVQEEEVVLLQEKVLVILHL
jgi:hypothetical protein